MHEALEKLRARGEVYRFLARAYAAPDRGTADSLEGAREAWAVLMPQFLAREWECLASCQEAPLPPIELSREYTRLFRGPVKAEAYPYESLYVDGEVMGKSTLDVVRRYGEAGVSIAEDFKDLPDHICVELEFMHYLCGRELAALHREAADEAAHLQDTARRFLRDHLSRWLPPFTALVTQCATTPYYLSLAEITREFIRREMSETD